MAEDLNQADITVLPIININHLPNQVFPGSLYNTVRVYLFSELEHHHIRARRYDRRVPALFPSRGVEIFVLFPQKKGFVDCIVPLGTYFV